MAAISGVASISATASASASVSGSISVSAAAGFSGSRQPADPFMAFRYSVALAGKGTLGGFSDVSGLGVENEVEPFRAGGVNNAEIMLPGAVKYATRVTLKRGLADSATLWNWYVAVLRGEMKRQDVTIAMRSADGSSSLSWTFVEALPVKWTGPDLHAGSSAVAFESVELVHKGLLVPSA